MSERDHGRGGYTLLEVSFALFIVLLLVGVAVPSIGGVLQEERLRSAARAVQVQAKTARALAREQGKPHRVVLEKGRVSLWAPPPTSPTASAPAAADLPKEPSPVATESLDPSLQVLVRRWPSETWTNVADAPQEWSFQPTGLCEPLTVKIVRGEDWIQLEFNPLTADVEEESHAFH